MSTPTFSQLISPNNATYWEGQLLNNNDGVSGLAQPPNALPTNSWVSGDPILSFLKIDAAAFADEDQAIANIAKGGYLSTAADPSLVAASGPFAGTSPWLTLWAHEMYAIDRSPATTTTGHVVLTPNANASPIPIVPGQLIVSDGANPPHYFTNTTGGTLAAAAPSAPPLVLTFAAQSPGSGYNLGDGATLVLVTALPGVSARTFSPGWLITTGNDIQTDAELILECQNSWATLGTGSPAGAYVTWALEAYLAPGCAAASSVERAVTSADSGTGQVTLTLAGQSAVVSDAAVAAVQTYITPKLPQCVTLLCRSAVQNELGLTVNLYGPATAQTAAMAQAVSNVAALVQTTPIGGFGLAGGATGISLTSLYAALTAPGVTDVEIASMSGANPTGSGPPYAAQDFIMLASEVATTSFALASITWNPS